MIVMNNFFFEVVRAGFLVFNHFNYLGIITAGAGFQGSHYFLCHLLVLNKVGKYIT